MLGFGLRKALEPEWQIVPLLLGALLLVLANDALHGQLLIGSMT